MNEPQVPNRMTRDQLKLLALKQRIGELTADYEDRIADIRADATQRFEAMSDALKESDETIEKLQEQLRKSNETEEKEDKPAKSTK